MNDSHIKEMETVADDVIGYVNDLYSYNIEQSKGHSHNIIPVIMHANPFMDHMGAVDRVHSLIQNSMNYFLQLEASLPSWGPEVDADVHVYVEGLKSWMRGLIFWSLETERYFGKSTPAVKQTRVVALRPQVSKVEARSHL